MSLDMSTAPDRPLLFPLAADYQYRQVLIGRVADSLAREDRESFNTVHQFVHVFLMDDAVTVECARLVLAEIADVILTIKPKCLLDDRKLIKTLIDTMAQQGKPAMTDGLDRLMLGVASGIWGEINHDNQYVQRVIQYISASYAQEISFDRLAKDLNLSRNYLSYLFHKQTGESFRDYLLKFRIRKAAELLESSGRFPMKEACRRVGFKDAAHFSRMFRLIIGCSPTQYRQTGGRLAAGLGEHV